MWSDEVPVLVSPMQMIFGSPVAGGGVSSHIAPISAHRAQPAVAAEEVGEVATAFEPREAGPPNDEVGRGVCAGQS